MLLIGPVIFVLEFKIGEKKFTSYATDQVWDYGLDLKNFHESSHNQFIAPILIATKVKNVTPIIVAPRQNDKLFYPIKCNAELLGQVFEDVLRYTEGADIDSARWEVGRYCPTPQSSRRRCAYNGHSVTDISRSDASAINLSSDLQRAISEIIRLSKREIT